MKEELISFSFYILISWDIWLKFKSLLRFLGVYFCGHHGGFGSTKSGLACKNGVPHLTAIMSHKVHTEIILKNPLAINWSDIISLYVISFGLWRIHLMEVSELQQKC